MHFLLHLSGWFHRSLFLPSKYVWNMIFEYDFKILEKSYIKTH